MHRQVIRDGRPCHLYMDLEYVPAVNPDADGNALVDVLLALVSDGIRLARLMANMSNMAMLTVRSDCVDRCAQDVHWHVLCVTTFRCAPLLSIQCRYMRLTSCLSALEPTWHRSRAFDRHHKRKCMGVQVGTATLLQVASGRAWIFRRERWGMAVQRDWFTELDSSTDAKFSRHVTLRLPGRAFACNRRAGAFIASVLASETVRATVLAHEMVGVGFERSLASNLQPAAAHCVLLQLLVRQSGDDCLGCAETRIVVVLAEAVRSLCAQPHCTLASASLPDPAKPFSLRAGR